MAADKYGVWAGERRNVGRKEIADVHLYTRSTKPTTVDLHQLLALGAYLKSLNMQMRKLQARLYGDTAGAETYVPQHVALR